MKEKWLDDKECTGCAACANICPTNAITMKRDGCGFTYPEISNTCIDCNACQNVCEKRGVHSRENSIKPKTYATWSKCVDTRFTSTSGGAFSEIARVILKRDGYVVGAQYNDECMVEHAIISDEEGLNRIRQSKYAESEIGLVFQEIKRLLGAGKWVAFCGAPCQVAGLYAYLGKEHEKLITMDFICRGMNSAKAYRAWLNELEQKYNSKVIRVWFKYKVGGWKNSPFCTRVDFQDGKNIVLDKKKNIYMMGYLAHNLYIRPSCGNCEFKGVPRQGDITLADFWGLSKELDDDKGASMVLLNSPKGEEVWRQATERMHFHEREFSEIFAGNICFDSSVEINSKSEAFLHELDEMTFSSAMKKYTKQSYVNKVKQKINKWRVRLKRAVNKLTKVV